MIKIERTPFPPPSLEKERRKKDGKYNLEDVVSVLQKDFHDKCYKLLIIHNFPLPQFLPYHIFRVTHHRNSFDTLFPLYYTFLFLQFNITKFFIL